MGQEIEYKKTRGRPRTADRSKPGGSVQSLDRAFGLLKQLAISDEATLTDLALRTGMAPSTAHRLLTTMESHGIVSFDEATQNWMVGVEAFRAGSSFIKRTNVVDVGRVVMHDLMKATGETANLAIADDGEVVFISQVDTHEAIRAFFPSGSRGPLHASGIGKALLSEMSREAVERILQQRGLGTFTHKTLTTPKALFADLEQIRERGWSVDDEERNVGMRCLASAIYNTFGEAIAGVSISGPTVRLTARLLVFDFLSQP
ncbi:MAG: HTH-type transcriptional regulator BhcR, partial [Pseudomonadota bacterium]